MSKPSPMKRDQEMLARIAEVENYRELLRELLNWRTARNGRPNYAEGARRCGFESRGFLLEVVQRRKRLTERSLKKVINGLKVKSDVKTLFEALVLWEERDPTAKPDEAKRLSDRIERIRSKIRNASRGDLSDTDRPEVFKCPGVCEVFAALGPPEEGTSLTELVRRTRLPQATVSNVLRHLESLGMVRRQTGRYYCDQAAVDIEKLGGDPWFRMTFKRTAAELSRISAEQFANPENLFIHFAFSVDQSKLIELKEKLRQVVIDFIDSEQNDRGNSVSKITLALHR